MMIATVNIEAMPHRRRSFIVFGKMTYPQHSNIQMGTSKENIIPQESVSCKMAAKRDLSSVSVKI